MNDNKRIELTHIMSKLRATLYDFVDVSSLDCDMKASFKRLIRGATDISWEKIKELLND